MKTFKKLLAILCTAALLLTSLSVGTVFATDTTVAVDYSNIDFDGENGTAGNMSSSKWSFYNAAENPVGENATKMLKVKTDATGNLAAWLLADGNYVAIESGKTYSLSFDYYADAGVDLNGMTVRDSGAIVTDKSDSSGLITAATLGLSTDGTAGAWKSIKLAFTADEDANLKVGITPKTAVSDVFIYFDNFSLIELPAETEGDYSNISFDTANGIAGNLSSSYWSFYDGFNGAIAGNATRMLKLDTNKSGNLMAQLTYGSNTVNITNGKVYRLDFDYYADAGIDFKQLTIRTSSAAIATDKSSSKVHNGTMMGITSENGTDGAWKSFRLYFTAPADSVFKIGVELNTATPDVYMYFDNFSLVELPVEAADDYSNISFDTANGTAGNLSSSVWSFYDAAEGIAGNDTRMLRLYTGKAKGSLAMNVTYGAIAVPIVAGNKYRLDFDFYCEAGVDFKEATIRNQDAHIKTISLPIDAEKGTNGKWVHQTAFFTASEGSATLKFGITTNSITENYMYFDNFSLTPFNPESPITFEGKKSGSAVDSSTSVWRYSTNSVAGNDTTKLVFSHTNGQANGSVYNDFDEAIAIEKGGYYIIEFDYYSDAYTGTLGAIFNNDIGYKCNLSLTAEEGTGGAWKTSSTIFKATGSTDKFKFSMQPQNASNVALYFDNVAIVKLYDCTEEDVVVENVTPNSIKVTAKNGYQYSVDGVHFTGSGIFNNLNLETGIYPIYYREAVTDNGYPSAASEAMYIQLPYAGDANNDKLLNADDLVLMRSHLLGFDTKIADSFFDASKDTNIDVRDIVNLKKQIAADTEIVSDITIVREGTTYSLAWNDDFTGSYIDRNKWADRKSAAENEYQYFKNGTDNLFMDEDVDGNSCLILQAVKETATANNRTYDYTSGGIDTYGKFDFKTGYVEMRAKLPKGAGLWSGFWFGGTSNRDGETTWPENGEIDVIEHYGYKADTVFHNFHYATYDKEGNIVANKIRPDDGVYNTEIDGNFYDSFHTFGCEWTEEYVAYYVDGVMTHKYVKDAETFAEINNEDMYLLVTLAVGGSEEAMADIGNTEFPAQMAVDYVRYYK